MSTILTINPAEISLGHCHPGTPPAGPGALITRVNGFNVMRVTDLYFPATCGDTNHPRLCVTGSTNVFVEGLPVFRTGDPISCGDFGGAGLNFVFVN